VAQRPEKRDAEAFEAVGDAVQHHRLIAVLEEEGFQDVPGKGLGLDLAEPAGVVAQVVEHRCA